VLHSSLLLYFNNKLLLIIQPKVAMLNEYVNIQISIVETVAKKIDEIAQWIHAVINGHFGH